jgi:hypothetical protein
MGGNLRVQRRVALGIVLAIAVSACQKSQYFSPQSSPRLASNTQSSASNSGNGSGFEGRLVVEPFIHVDSLQPCPDRGQDGLPLPNQEIFVTTSTSGKSTLLVRDACLDLPEPRPLAISDVHLVNDAAGSLAYQGALFVPHQAASESDVVAANCPTGRTPRAGVSRKSLLADAQNLLGSSWTSDAGIATTLSGSLGGLPRVLISRNDSSYLDSWRRLNQSSLLTPGHTYAATFLAAPGALDHAVFSVDDENKAFTLEVTLDLKAGSSQILYNTGAQSVTSTARSFAAGMLATVYFTAPPAARASYFGLSSFRTNAVNPDFGTAGDSIGASAIQLEDVADFCQ